MVGEPVTLSNLTAIDCDVHPTVPEMKTLWPYLSEMWREVAEQRGIDYLDTMSYPPAAPLSARADWREKGLPASSTVEQMRSNLLAHRPSSLAICNPLYGVQLVYNADMAAAFTTALNEWTAQEWLDKEPRLRASIVVPLQDINLALAEIERRAGDPRFVQIMVLAMGETLLGRRSYWPIYEAAQKHGLPIAIHAGSAYRHPLTSLGWPSYFLEDYTSQAQGFQAQVASMICEGVFVKYPELKVVLLESGVTWVPGFLWRLAKFWRGVRAEVPWVNRPPPEIFRDHFRISIQPFDGPDDDPAAVAKIIEHLQSDDLLLFASDYPHWQFDGDEPMPAGIPEQLHRKILIDNPLATYPRIRASLGA